MDWFSWLSKTGLDSSLIYDYGLAFSRNQLQMEDTAYFNHEFLQSMGISVAKHRLEILKLAKKQNGSGHPRSVLGLSWALLRAKKCFGKYFTRWVFNDDVAGKNAGDPTVARYQEHWRGALLRKHKWGEVAKEERPVMVKTRRNNIALSGPLDGRVQERLMAHNTRSLKLSGPLDGKVHERLMYTANKSPRLTVTGPPAVDGNGRAPERLMVATTRSPRLSGPLDAKLNEKPIFINKSPRFSGPLDGRVVSPKFCSPFEKDRVEIEYDDHSLWTALFQDMKPT